MALIWARKGPKVGDEYLDERAQRDSTSNSQLPFSCCDGRLIMELPAPRERTAISIERGRVAQGSRDCAELEPI